MTYSKGTCTSSDWGKDSISFSDFIIYAAFVIQNLAFDKIFMKAMEIRSQ